MNRVLIAYDGSECSRKALSDLKYCGISSDAHIYLLAVADIAHLSTNVITSPYLAPEYLLALEKANEHAKQEIDYCHKNLEEAYAYLKNHFPKWEVTRHTKNGSPVETILEKAKAWDAQMILMGSHGRSALARVFFGSVSLGVLNHACCSVRVARERSGALMAPLRMVVGMDGSFSSEYAARKILERSWPKTTTFSFVAACDPRLATAFLDENPSIKPWLEKVDKDPMDWVKRMLKHWVSEFEKAGYVASDCILPGDPKDIVLRHARQIGADCIFLGSRGLGMGQRLILGSSSCAIAARADCSVEIIKTCGQEHS